LERSPNTFFYPLFLGVLYGSLYYKLELMAIVGVEANLEVGSPYLVFGGSDLTAIAGVALIYMTYKLIFYMV
jgi:hypothetical protein